MPAGTWEAPTAACCTLREISRLAFLCSSAVATIPPVISDMLSIVDMIALIATTTADAVDWISPTWPEIWLVALAVCAAILDLGDDHRETSSGLLPGPGRHDRRVERKKVRLFGDGRNSVTMLPTLSAAVASLTIDWSVLLACPARSAAAEGIAAENVPQLEGFPTGSPTDVPVPVRARALQAD